MSKPRIVVPFVVQFAVRYALRTGLLIRISKYAQPIVLLRWEDEVLSRELRDSGIEVYQLPETSYHVNYTRLKRQLDLLQLSRLRSPTTAIDDRRARTISPPSLRSQLRDAYYRTTLKLPGRDAQLRRLFDDAIWRHTNVRVFADQLVRIRADAILSLTPYFQHEQLLLYAAKVQGLSLLSSMLSFDNITTRGWIPIIFDAYYLWNDYNKDELSRAYPEAEQSNAIIVGAPQFDFYWDPSYVWGVEEWHRLLGIPLSRPVILFGAGHNSIVPHEPHWLKQIDEGIENGAIRDKPIVLFRKHPNDPIERWLPVLKDAKHVIRDDPWDTNDTNPALANIRRHDIERLASSLAHSHVHINASSTMTVDGAIFDRPQIGPAYDDRPGRPFEQITRELYTREHYLPITRSGGLQVVESFDELGTAVNSSIRSPLAGQRERKQLVMEVCTYDDGRCTERLDREIRSFLVGKR